MLRKNGDSFFVVPVRFYLQGGAPLFNEFKNDSCLSSRTGQGGALFIDISKVESLLLWRYRVVLLVLSAYIFSMVCRNNCMKYDNNLVVWETLGRER